MQWPPVVTVADLSLGRAGLLKCYVSRDGDEDAHLLVVALTAIQDSLCHLDR
jgi:hypothetical protein